MPSADPRGNWNRQTPSRYVTPRRGIILRPCPFCGARPNERCIKFALDADRKPYFLDFRKTFHQERREGHEPLKSPGPLEPGPSPE
jgi:hypothetical protein